MTWLWFLLAILNPMPPGRRTLATARFMLTAITRELADPSYAEELDADPKALAQLNAWLCDVETLVHIAAGYAVVSLLGLPNLARTPCRQAEPRSGKTLTLRQVLARYRRCLALVEGFEDHVDRLGDRLGRKRDADPLRLTLSSPLAAFALSGRPHGEQHAERASVEPRGRLAPASTPHHARAPP